MNPLDVLWFIGPAAAAVFTVYLWFLQRAIHQRDRAREELEDLLWKGPPKLLPGPGPLVAPPIPLSPGQSSPEQRGFFIVEDTRSNEVWSFPVTQILLRGTKFVIVCEAHDPPAFGGGMADCSLFDFHNRVVFRVDGYPMPAWPTGGHLVLEVPVEFDPVLGVHPRGPQVRPEKKEI